MRNVNIISRDRSVNNQTSEGLINYVYIINIMRIMDSGTKIKNPKFYEQ